METASGSSGYCLIGLSFGFRNGPEGSILPGTVNTDLAAFAQQFAGKYPLLLQHEIADVLWSAGIPPALRIAAPDSQYLDSRQVLLQAKEHMDLCGYTTAIIVAQKHHVLRIKLLCKKLGIKAFIPAGLPASWDAESAQPWTRSLWLWMLREPLVLIHHKLRGWI